MIRVIDDGSGMNHDDALLAFERHATSKLRTADDLLSIGTLGLSRRGAAIDRVDFAAGAGNAHGGRRARDARGIRGRKACRSKAGGRAAGHFDQRCGHFLLRSGAAEIPEIRDHRTGAHRVARHALRARASRPAIPAEDAHAGNPELRAGGKAGRPRLPGVRAPGARRTHRDSAQRSADALGDHRAADRSRTSRRRPSASPGSRRGPKCSGPTATEFTFS